MPSPTELVPVRRIVSSVCALGMCACAAARPPQGVGKLQQATDEVSKPSRRSSADQRGGDHSRESYGEDGTEESSGGILADIVVGIFGFPFWLPHELMEERPGEMDHGFYLPWPYAVAGQGYLARSRHHGDTVRQPYSLRAGLDYGRDFDDIERIGATLRIESAMRLGLDASWSHYREDLAGSAVDTLDLGDVNLTYRFAQAGYGEMRTGLGLNWFADGSVDEYGLNFTYAGDFYVADPLVTTFELDLGTLGGATRFHGRATVGAAWNHCELWTGFDYESLDSVDLPTWVVGLRVWF